MRASPFPRSEQLPDADIEQRRLLSTVAFPSTRRCFVSSREPSKEPFISSRFPRWLLFLAVLPAVMLIVLAVVTVIRITKRFLPT